MYDSEMNVKAALNRLDRLQDRLQNLYDSLSQAVVNGRYAINVERLELLSVEFYLMQGTAQNALVAAKTQIDDVLSAEKQFLEEVD